MTPVSDRSNVQKVGPAFAIRTAVLPIGMPNRPRVPKVNDDVWPDDHGMLLKCLQGFSTGALVEMVVLISLHLPGRVEPCHRVQTI